ncbi:uncharacterized protein LOC119179476 isoform X2 [Rhipicephalus microplus]|uniref:uncharacterized protein LOC119179476 isoform X2 n=1 Tax=Rhipicephalus microplus TaxID=6941 RepID=UPI0018877619|nr:uncharacterized protein LOC119179476 isoform X2 [Rhipicephalus microplus]
MNPQLEALVGCGIAGPVIPRAPRCIVPVCHSRVAPSSILYPLPTVPSLRQAWIDFVRACPCGGACDWEPPTGEISLVCSLHFTVSCFRFQRPRGSSTVRKCLKSGAVPTLYPIEEQCDLTTYGDSPDNTAEDSDKMEANVKGSGSQHRGMRIERQSRWCSPRTPPHSAAWTWLPRQRAVVSELCPRLCSTVVEFISINLERL